MSITTKINHILNHVELDENSYEGQDEDKTKTPLESRLVKEREVLKNKLLLLQDELISVKSLNEMKFGNTPYSDRNKQNYNHLLDYDDILLMMHMQSATLDTILQNSQEENLN